MLYQKLYHKIYTPLTTAILAPAPDDDLMPNHRKLKLDRLYEQVDHAIENLTEAVGILDDVA